MHHPKNVTRTGMAASSMPMHSMLDELPNGVPMPPMSAAAGMPSTSAFPKPESFLVPPFASTMDRLMPTKMALAARSAMNMENMPVAIMRPITIFALLPLDHFKTKFATRYGIGVVMTAAVTAKMNRQ